MPLALLVSATNHIPCQFLANSTLFAVSLLRAFQPRPLKGNLLDRSIHTSSSSQTSSCRSHPIDSSRLPILNQHFVQPQSRRALPSLSIATRIRVLNRKRDLFLISTESNYCANLTRSTVMLFGTSTTQSPSPTSTYHLPLL